MTHDAHGPRMWHGVGTMRQRTIQRRRLAALLVAVVVVAGVVVVLLGRGGEPSGPRRLAPGAGTTDATRDPFGYDADRRADFETAAAAGLSHVLCTPSRRAARYATAQRVAALPAGDRGRRQARPPGRRTRWRRSSSWRARGAPDVTASDDLDSAVGLTQILAQTATGLLGLKVDVAQVRAG